MSKGPGCSKKRDHQPGAKRVKGTAVSEHSAVQTGGNGRAILEIDDGNAIRLDHNSTVRFGALSGSHIVVRNLRGRVYTRVCMYNGDCVNYLNQIAITIP